LTGALLLVWMGSAASTAWAQQIESITLSSAGMAEIERQIPISDAGTAQLRVPLTQVDDILKTLMAVDGKNRIESLTLSGLAPLKESFDSLPFSAKDLRSPATLAQTLRGQQVSASSQGRLVRGAVLGVQATAATNERPAQAILSVLTEQGQIQTLELGPDTSLEILDKTLQQQLQQATQVLAGQSNQQSRDIQLVLNKTDTQSARLSYLIPAPVWKSSYRLMMQDGKARLQAWAIFENTSGEDWKDVKVTLSSGSPVMLRQRLLERYWNERPELPVAVGSSIAPQADTQATVSANQARRAAGVIILGGMRLGLFTPTEAAVVAVFYGLFVGMVIHRTIKFRDLFLILREAAELSAVIMMVVALAGIFAWALSTLSIIDPVTNAIINSGLGEYGILALMIVMLIVLGMFLDGISIFLIFVPLFMPIAYNFGWHPVWFGVLLTLNVALGQFTPPVAVNLMVACRIAGVPMESTLRWVGWLLLGMGSTMLLVIAEPEIALWLPRYLGFN
jgi:hypothetical protein